MNGISPKEAKKIAAKRRAEMRKLLKRGVSKSEIARRYGISRQRVLQLIGAG
jgi:DNA invertase Pin-like site-specific DNA recombinase